MNKIRFEKLIWAGLLSAVLSLPCGASAQTAAPGQPVVPAQAAPPSQAQLTDTGCDVATGFPRGYFLRDGREVFDKEMFAAYALRLNTPIYQASAGDARTARSLRFGERVGIIDPGRGTDRLQVKDSNAQTLGWVTRSSVLCKTDPIRDSGPDGRSGTGLYKRALVRTETAVQGQLQPKPLFQTPAGGPVEQRCAGRCNEASRFQWFFIYAEENDHYLISNSANLKSSSATLEGWLPKSDGYVWNTALGIRPREDLPPIPPPPGSARSLEGFACAYRTPQDLASGTDCSQILGGRRWFGLDVRIAVLKETAQYYEVLFSNAATAGRPVDVSGLNRLDVFFVIDGTKSMGPTIEAIKQLTKAINERIGRKFTQGGGSGVVRYGFRVYRDSVKGGTDGVKNSEALPLPRDKCDQDNSAAFNKAFVDVSARDPDTDDDFPENSFGGIVQASEDAMACGKDAAGAGNGKMIVVIGDHGYDGVKQQSRGQPSWTEDQVVARLKDRLGPSAMLLFVQTPREQGPAGQGVEYDKAYKAFEAQGKAILSKYYAGTQFDNPAQKNFIALPPGTVATNATLDTAWQQIDPLVRPQDTRGVEDALARGEGLRQYIEKAQNNSKENIPVFWKVRLNEIACPQINAQCDGAIVEQVTHAYMKNDPNVVPEVLLSKFQVDQWMKVLNVFKTSQPRGEQARSLLVNSLLIALSDIMQINLQNNGLQIGLAMQLASGLPNAGRSKLMQYSDTELGDPARVPECEIEYLKQYAGRKYDILNISYGSEGRLRPVFRSISTPAGACPNLSEKGKALPYIDGTINPEALNRANEQTSYKMSHQRGNETFFWLPVNYLP